jgi:hypothetical protein
MTSEARNVEQARRATSCPATAPPVATTTQKRGVGSTSCCTD